MKKALLPLFLLMLFLSLKGQQLPVFTQYRQYHSYLNPAAVNNDYYLFDGQYNLNISASYRHQWTGEGGTPKTALLSGEYVYTPKYGGVGLVGGLHVLKDDTDPFSMTGVYGRVAGLLSNDYQGFSAGLTFGGVQYRFDASGFDQYYLIARAVENNPDLQSDPLLGNDYVDWFPDFGAGIFYYCQINSRSRNWDSDKFYIGLSAPQLFGLDYHFDYQNNGKKGQLAIKREAHYYALAGFYKTLANNSYIELSTWVKYLASRQRANFDFNLRGRIQSQYFLGVGASTAGTLHLETGIYLRDNRNGDWSNNIKIGYGFDYSFTSYGPYFGASHEINLTFMLDTQN
ncbi:MAG: PorP/SprF family type IX secretion system membrane protein [Saprospiraceae bacterium]|nr:PorP/SprF family type IX secretion system membrane protein [Saprospiraceae bacterium]MCF8251228.1 PorP/SprF family type IX secretion system membrane protein [Saprospiraceae bacterium]MCF8281212.1 PorP/SprF family type IX secretion system membrane protein [Bacteroidales bacterium]MCF8313148.1 PorP/SprF family type IX secretion system membrane protein [Saprospiraceae bacterium]MCF8441590.1 PorP/SprF family type IX secretion system membrane protein [Saprospiraceae bacterium]